MAGENIRNSFILCTIVILVILFACCFLGGLTYLTNKYISNDLPDFTWPEFQQFFQNENTMELLMEMKTVISKVYSFYQKWKEQQQELNDNNLG